MDRFFGKADVQLRLGLAVLCLTLLVAPVKALAAKGIGLVMPLCCDLGDETKDRFARALQQAGIPPGDVELLVQRPGVDKVSIANGVRKLIAYDAKVLVVFGGTAAQAAVQEARDTPVVFIGVYDPVGEGLIQSLEKPGKNMTGVYCKTSLPFLLDNIQETAPGLSSLGVIFHSDSLDSQAQLSELKGLAAKRNLQLLTADLRGSTAEAAGKTVQPAAFVYLAGGCWPDLIGSVDLERLNKPLASQCQNAASARPVLNLAPDEEEMIAEAARLTARLLRGEKASQVPVSTARKIAFVIDLQSAQRLGLKVPFTVLGRATKIVQ